MTGAARWVAQLLRRGRRPGRVPPDDTHRRPGVALERRGPLVGVGGHPEHKDPNLAFDGARWHLFATGCGGPGGLELVHATASTLHGPWIEQPAVGLAGGPPMAMKAAPGVIAEGPRLHLFLQQHFDRLGGTVEHYASDDGGTTFVHLDTALTSTAATAQAGLYDPDPAEVHGVRHLTYAAMAEVGRPELFIVRSESGSWSGPWTGSTRILGHEDVPFHNQLGDCGYEWGLEGPQLVELPDATVLLIAVCFLRGRRAGQRQRVLFATAEAANGPYRVLGPLLDPSGGKGENGHGCAVVAEGRVHVVYQERAGTARPWHLRSAELIGPGGAGRGPERGDSR